MDRFLQIRELKDKVCLDLGSDHPSLLSLLLTCRSFVEPSLDRLWRETYLVSPLLSCLPEDAYRSEKTSSVFHNRYTVFPNADRELTSADLERFQTHYAHRIRVVHAGGRVLKGTFSPEFLQALVSATNGQLGSLSPRLKTFRWNGSPFLRTVKQILPYLTLLVGTSVTSIALPRIVADLDGDVALTASRLPHLEDVSLRHADLDFVDKFMTLAAPSGLKSIKISNVSDSMIPSLASLPKLESLTFEALDGITPKYAQQVSSNSKSFRTLRNLHITSSDFETAVYLLQHLPPTTTLQELLCSIPQISTPTASQAIIDAVASHINPATLSTLQVMDYCDTGLDDFKEVGPHLGFGGVVIDVTPLFRFTSLTNVSLFFYGRVQVTPSDAKMIATSWTQLEKPDLSGTHPIDRVPTIDHSHLFQILEGCPKLRHLGVPFDGRGIQGNETSARGPFPNIEHLGVCGSLVEYPSSFAAFFIRTNFPAARLSRSYPEGLLISSEPSWKRWMDVGDALDPEGPAPRDDYMF